MSTPIHDIDRRTNRAPQRLQREITSYEEFARLRQDWRRNAATPLLLQSEHATLVQFPGADIHVIANGDQTAGAVSIFEQTIHPGFVARNHHQAHEEELFFILDGDMKLTIGNQTVIAQPGSFGYAPRWCTHHFEPAGDRPSTMLTWNSPAGHERIFEAFAGLVAKGLHTHGPTRKAAVEAHDTNFHDLSEYADDPEHYVQTEERPGARGRAVSARTNRRPGDSDVARHVDERDPLTYPVLVSVDEVATKQGAGVRSAVLLDAELSAGNWSVFYRELPAGYSQPAAVQQGGWRAIHVLSGAVAITAGAMTTTLGPRGCSFVPPGARFGMRIEGSQQASVLIISSPAAELSTDQL
jgi:mannose-6-phosphate isomerase-like protein (cupin superfamily)